MRGWYKIKPKKYIFFFLLLILFSFNCYAASPFDLVSSHSGDTGLEINSPPFATIQQNTAFEFEIHLFNESNGAYITDADCFFHLYNSTGKHIAELNDSTPNHKFDFSFNVGGGNFSKIGDYAYVIQCNTSYGGGFISVPIEITASGFTEPDLTIETQKENQLLIYFALIFAIALLVFSFWKDDATLAAVSGMVKIVLGVYIAINGFSTLDNIMSQALALVLIAIGAYVLLRSMLFYIGEFGGT